jgi:hypothetical protein
MKALIKLCFFLILASAIFSCKKSAAPNPTPIEPPKKDTDVYLVGTTMAKNGYYIATYWKNGVAYRLGDSSQYTFGEAISVNGSDVYVTGYALDTGFNPLGGRLWKNNVVSSIASSTPRSIALSGTDVFIAGLIPVGLNYGLYLKNNVVVSPTNGNTKYVDPYGITISGSDVYVVGTNVLSDNHTQVAAYWKNGTETQLSTTSSIAYRIAVSGTDVYVAGSNIFPLAYTSTNAVYWKNGTQIVLSTLYSYGYDVAVNGSDVYVTGNCSPPGQLTSVASYWKNGTIHQMINGSLGSDSFAIALSGSNVFVAGDQEVTVNGIKEPVYWKNDQLVRLSPNNYGQALGIVIVPR